MESTGALIGLGRPGAIDRGKGMFGSCRSLLVAAFLPVRHVGKLILPRSVGVGVISVVAPGRMDPQPQPGWCHTQRNGACARVHLTVLLLWGTTDHFPPTRLADMSGSDPPHLVLVVAVQPLLLFFGQLQHGLFRESKGGKGSMRKPCFLLRPSMLVRIFPLPSTSVC